MRLLRDVICRLCRRAREWVWFSPKHVRGSPPSWNSCGRLQFFVRGSGLGWRERQWTEKKICCVRAVRAVTTTAKKWEIWERREKSCNRIGFIFCHTQQLLVFCTNATTTQSRRRFLWRSRLSFFCASDMSKKWKVSHANARAYTATQHQSKCAHDWNHNI